MYVLVGIETCQSHFLCVTISTMFILTAPKPVRTKLRIISLQFSKICSGKHRPVQTLIHSE